MRGNGLKLDGLSLKYYPAKRAVYVQGNFGSFLFKVGHMRMKYQYNKLWLTPTHRVKKSFFNLAYVLLSQSCLGVFQGFRCQLNLMGIGYQVHVEKKNAVTFLVLKLGLSHLVRIRVPSFLIVSCPKPRTVQIKGINFQKVNDFASLLKSLKLPNPYKEKGFYYVGERIKLKQGKKT